tara:strand:+ start:1653 stop:3293 length:1641 start_codon:yes stop_codon:yes gene_type:complete
MKKFIFIAFSSLIVLFSSIFILIKNIDKGFIKKKIVSEFSSNFVQDLDFSEDIELNFFPNLSAKISDVNLIDRQKGLHLYVEHLFLNLNLISILKQEIQINKVKLDNPKLKLNVNKFKISQQKSPKIIHKVSKSVISTKKPILFNYIKINKGYFEIENKEQRYIFDDINLTYEKTSFTQINGNLKNKLFLSDFFIKINFKNFDNVNFSIEHNFFNSNIINYVNGDLKLIDGKINIMTDVESDFFDINKILNTQFKKSFFINKSNNFISINNNKRKLQDIIVNINAKLKKIKFNEFIFENIITNININDNKLYIKDLNGNYLDAKYNLNCLIDSFNQNINGILVLENFPIISSLNKKTKRYLGSGKLNTSFRFNKQNFSADIYKNLKLEGKFVLNDLILKGINIDKVILLIDKIENFNNIINQLSDLNIKGSTKIKIIEGDFFLENSIIKFVDIISEDEKITFKGEGNFNVSNQNFFLRNRIKIKTKKYEDFPEFGINISGDLDNYNLSYDMEKVKQHFFDKTLKKILKNNDNKIIINPNEILDLFK